jgi:hypothetical protein
VRLALWAWLPALLSIAPRVEGSPDPAHWRREVLIGANSQDFFYLEFLWEQKGTYYESTESVFICRASLAQPEEIEKTIIRRIVRRTDPGTGERSAQEDSIPAFDLVEHIRRNQVTLAYADSWPSDPEETFAVAEEGLVLIAGAFRFSIMSMADIKKQIPDLQEHPRVESIQQVRDNETYLTIVSGYRAGDSSIHQDILVVSNAVLRDAQRELRRKLHLQGK